ncbi:hypothetical protein [Streptomyces sp. NPDC003077]|uniref:hypothetical protein n=1 Tax=Streptomyces sp. NPDC003077 TaxID=3154443 RepID=UPI0033B9C531
MIGRSRTVRVPRDGTTVHIPHQGRGGRQQQPMVVLLPDRPSLTREALGWLGRLLWRRRGALAPTALAVAALPLTALLHAVAWWSGLLLAPAAVLPLGWLTLTQRRRPVRGPALAWRAGLAVLGAAAFAWVALATGFGPLAGPMEVVWLLTWLAAQTAWLLVRRSL